MPKSKLSIALFAFVTAVVCGFASMFLSRFFIPKDAGLTAGAMVVGYGVLGLFAGLIIALIGQRWLDGRQLRTLNIVFGAVSLALFGWLAYMVNTTMREARREAERYRDLPIAGKAEVTAPAVDPEPKLSAGIGMAKTILSFPTPVYFYNTPGPDQIADMLSPIDSVTLKTEARQTEIATAPPWLVPEILKLDYQLFYFTVKSRTRYMLEVVVNTQTGRTAWIDRERVDFMGWPSFLLTVHSVEAKNPADNPVRVKPLTHAGLMTKATDQHFLRPVKVQEDWLQVEVLDPDFQAIGTGWIRWQAEGELLVNYNLLS